MLQALNTSTSSNVSIDSSSGAASNTTIETTNDNIASATLTSPATNITANNKSLISTSLSSLSLNNVDNENPNETSPSTPSLSGSRNNQLNEKVAHLATSVYQELEKTVKLYGRDTVKELMPVIVNILEALDVSYQEKEEQIVENELLKEDYEQLLNQYEREKQSRKDYEQKLFQSEDSIIDQKKEYEEKLQSLESIVRMIELKAKNASDHANRLEEKENEMKREYSKLHERYTELFKTHCDYMERTKLLFGTDRLDQLQILISNNNNNLNLINNNSNNVQLRSNNKKSTDNKQQQHQRNSDLIESSSNGKQNNQTKADIDDTITNLLTEIEQQQKQFEELEHTTNTSNTNTNNNNDNTKLASNQNDKNENNKLFTKQISDAAVNTGCFNTNNVLQSSDNFDEHLTEFDGSADNQKELEIDEIEDINCKNDLSLFNELSRENYDPTELDDGADLSGMTREVANLIRENNELLQTKHALNVLKDDLIAKLDSFSSEMVILREEIKTLQTVKGCLQLRISELEEESKKTKEELSTRIKKQEEEDSKVKRSKHVQANENEIIEEQEKQRERIRQERKAEKLKKLSAATTAAASHADTTTTTTTATTTNTTTATTTRKTTATNNKRDNNNNGGGNAGAFSFFYSMMPTEILGVPVTEIKRDLKDSTDQLSTFFSDLFGYKNQEQQQQQSPSTSQQRSTPSSTAENSPTKRQQQQQQQQLINDTFNINTKSVEQVVPYTQELMNSTERSVRKEDDLHLKSSNKYTDQYKQLKAHIVKDDGRMQAYGWSLPSKKSLLAPTNESKSDGTNNKNCSTVPIPIYCKPLFDVDNSYKLSCASAVNLDYSKSIKTENTEHFDENLIKQCPFYNVYDSVNKSSFIWIANLYSNDTHVSILDANRPQIQEQFFLNSLKVLCIQGVPGAKENEYPLSKELLDLYEERKCVINESIDDSNTDQHTSADITDDSVLSNKTNKVDLVESSADVLKKDVKSLNDLEEEIYDSAKMKQIISNRAAAVSSSLLNDGDNTVLSTIYPTMWFGSLEGWLFIHSTVKNVSRTIDKVKLKDSILSITYNCGRVLVALADGTIVMFHRKNNGSWDLANYNIISFGKPHHSIRCLTNVMDSVWCGCRNKIFVISPTEFKIVTTIEAHPRKESQVRHMVWIGEGVWISIRLDSTLRLFHAKTHQHLQYLDVEPFVTRMLGSSNTGLSLIRISSLQIIAKQLWIGTGNGVVISIPFTDSLTTSTNQAPGSAVRVGNSENPTKSNSEYIPYCNLSEAQFSFHGHRDAVKFFVSVPGHPVKSLSKHESNDTNKTDNQNVSIVLSGGQGYIDFRVGDSATSKLNEAQTLDEFTDNNNSKTNTLLTYMNKIERSHLIVWQITSSSN